MFGFGFRHGAGCVPAAPLNLVQTDIFAVGTGSQRVGGRADARATNSILYGVGSTEQVFDFEVTASTSSLATPLADFDPARGITFGATLKVTAGTSVPAVTVGGTLTFSTGAPGLRIKITDVSGGTGSGQAKFQYSTNNGATWNGSDITTGSGVALTGGTTATFPAGTYATDQVWAATVETWTSREGNAYTVTNATAAQQPIYFSSGLGVGSLPYLLFDGTDDRLVGTISAVTTAFANANPYTLFYQAAHNVVDANWGVVSVGNASSGNGKRYWGQSLTGSGRYNTAYRNDAGTALNVDRSVNDVDTSAHVFEWYTSAAGTEISLQVDGGTANPNAVTSNPGTNSPNRLCFGCEFDSTPGLFFNGKLGRARFHGAVLDASQRAAERTVLAVL